MAGGSEEPKVGMAVKEGCVDLKVEMECMCCIHAHHNRFNRAGCTCPVACIQTCCLDWMLNQLIHIPIERSVDRLEPSS